MGVKIRLMTDFFNKTIEPRRQLNDTFKALKGKQSKQNLPTSNSKPNENALQKEMQTKTFRRYDNSTIKGKIGKWS